MIVLILFLVFGFSLFYTIALSLAYSEGRDDARRTYGTYSNGYWMPMAWAYDRAYTKHKGLDYTSMEDLNRERFGRK